MTIKLRLIISVIAVLVLLLMGNLFTKYIMNQSVEAVEQIIEVNSVKLSLLNQLKNLSDERAIMQRNMVILLDDEALALESNRLTESSLSIGVLFKRLVEMNLDDVETGFLRDLRANAADAFNLFGGFMGSEKNLSDRNPLVNKTIINGAGASCVINIKNC
jgi:methyl-accepting chemotaxis protein